MGTQKPKQKNKKADKKDTTQNNQNDQRRHKPRFVMQSHFRLRNRKQIQTKNNDEWRAERPKDNVSTLKRPVIGIAIGNTTKKRTESKQMNCTHSSCLRSN